MLRPETLVWREGLAAWTRFLLKAVREGGTITIIHRADRLDALASGGHALIDYKTDAVSSGREVEDRTSHYVPQVQAYRRAVCRMYGLEPAAVEGGALTR